MPSGLHSSQGFSQDTARKLENPLVTVDIVVLTILEGKLKSLLIQRQNQPFQGMWAIPGGFIYTGETLEEAAVRWLREKTNVTDPYLEQLQAFGNPKRDPRARVITVAYCVLIPATSVISAVGGPSGMPYSAEHSTLRSEHPMLPQGTQWHPIDQLPALAFDHDTIVKAAIERLREKLLSSTVACRLLPEKFTLTELQRVYELILNRKLDKRNFRKKILASTMLIQLEEKKMEGFHRPAQLYQMNATFQASDHESTALETW
ncbi:MAG: NUDIX hydrolase [Vampirovibrionales bacterium]